MPEFYSFFKGCFILVYIAAGMCVLLGIRPKRLSRREKWFLLCLLCAFALAVLILLLFGIEVFVTYFPLFAFLPLYGATLILQKYRGFKGLFIFLTALVWTSPLLLAANTLALFFPGVEWLRMAAHILLGLLMLWLLDRYFKAPLIYLLDHIEQGWALFCAVPFLCVAVTYRQTMYRFTYDVASFRDTFLWQYTLSALCFLTYILIVRYSQEIKVHLEALGNDELLRAQMQGALQYAQSLKKSQLQADLYEHDLRHHLQLISTMSMREDTEGIRQYIAGIEQGIAAVSPQHFCMNETVNLILSAFHAKAEKLDVHLEIQADIPAVVRVPDGDLCVIVSNALENAIRAASAVTSQPRVVRFLSRTRNDQLLIEITNPCEEEVSFQDDLPVSRQGDGIGVKSIQLAVTSLGGLVKFELNQRQFAVKLIL
ncbi:MAG: GHKL domain-containing protein [Clostridiales bacterium]|nr:GHKL domain-containing protein [Clostridiales bacterium]